MNEKTMLLIGFLLLMQFSNKISHVRAKKIEMIKDLENWQQTLNQLFLTALNQNVLQDIKNTLRMVIWMQKSMRFHSPHYEMVQL